MSAAMRSEVWIINNTARPQHPFIMVRSVRGGPLIWACSREHAARIAGAEDAAEMLRVQEMTLPSPERQMVALSHNVPGDAQGFLLMDAVDSDAFEEYDPQSGVQPEAEVFFIVDKKFNSVGNIYLNEDEAFAAIAAYRSGQIPDLVLASTPNGPP